MSTNPRKSPTPPPPPSTSPTPWARLTRRERVALVIVWTLALIPGVILGWLIATEVTL